LADGAGPSIWHRFVRRPGAVRDGDTGDTACDHYRRTREDVALMRDLGLQAYRFSIAWGRVLPEGRGRVNRPGLAFYERLVDELLRAGIEPMATLYHWDLPAALGDRGGWLNPDIAQWFGDYAELMFRALDHGVHQWVTVNEPWVVADGGYLHGEHAPGHRSAFESAIVSHQLLRAHAEAVKRYRAVGRHQIGIAVNIEPKHPARDTPADHAACRGADAYMNRQYLDPLFFGRYPEELHDVFGEAWPDWPDAEVQALQQTIDFVGINYYTRSVNRHDKNAWPLHASPVRQKRATHTETGWEVFAQGLADTLLWVRERYGDLPLYVTENGAAFYDPPSANAGVINDPLRVDYLQQHLRALHDTIGRGVDVRGYYAWSLFDNLEWAHGFSKRFGLVHVDFETQVRTPKDSARFYSSVIASHGAVLGSDA
jgi:beta-glucosidase